MCARDVLYDDRASVRVCCAKLWGKLYFQPAVRKENDAFYASNCVVLLVERCEDNVIVLAVFWDLELFNNLTSSL